MTAREQLVEEIKETPDAILAEVAHCLRYRRAKAELEPFDGLALTASALARDWLSPEEEEAWKTL